MPQLPSSPPRPRSCGMAWLLAGCLCLPLATVAAKSGSGQLYRWVDDKGQVHFGDKIPPEYAKQARDELNKQGMVTKSMPREPTAEDLERLRAEEAQREEDERRAAHDRNLLKLFSSVADLQAQREERLSTLDGRILLAEKAAADNEKTLDELRARINAKTPDEKLSQQISSFETSLVDNLQLVQRLRVERSETEQRYSADIERFKLLRAGKIKPGA